MDTKNHKTHLAKGEEAKKIIKAAKAGSTFNVYIRIDLPIDGGTDHFFRDGGSSYISVSKKDALRLAGELVSETLEGRGARLPIQSYDRDTYRFKGGEPNGPRTITTYWIG